MSWSIKFNEPVHCEGIRMDLGWTLHLYCGLTAVPEVEKLVM